MKKTLMLKVTMMIRMSTESLLKEWEKRPFRAIWTQPWPQGQVKTLLQVTEQRQKQDRN